MEFTAICLKLLLLCFLLQLSSSEIAVPEPSDIFENEEFASDESDALNSTSTVSPTSENSTTATTSTPIVVIPSTSPSQPPNPPSTSQPPIPPSTSPSQPPNPPSTSPSQPPNPPSTSTSQPPIPPSSPTVAQTSVSTPNEPSSSATAPSTSQPDLSTIGGKLPSKSGLSAAARNGLITLSVFVAIVVSILGVYYIVKWKLKPVSFRPLQEDSEVDGLESEPEDNMQEVPVYDDQPRNIDETEFSTIV